MICCYWLREPIRHSWPTNAACWAVEDQIPVVNLKLITGTPHSIATPAIGDRLPWYWVLPRSPLFVTIVANRGTTSATASSFWRIAARAEEAGMAETAEGAAQASRMERAEMAELAGRVEQAGRMADVAMEVAGRLAVDGMQAV